MNHCRKVILLWIVMVVGLTLSCRRETAKQAPKDSEEKIESESYVIEDSMINLTILEGVKVVEGKWGDGPGEFGIIATTECELPAGPSTFCIDKDENIYISDDINFRLKKYNSKGELLTIKSTRDLYRYIDDMTIDMNGNIFCIVRKKKFGRLAITSMDSEFNISQEYLLRKLLKESLEGYGGLKIFASDSTTIFLKGFPQGLIKISEFNEVEVLDSIFFVSSDMLVKFHTQLDTSVNCAKSLEISRRGTKDNRIINIKHLGPRKAAFYGMDLPGRIFLMSITGDRDRGILNVYSSEGIFLDSISIKVGYKHYSAGGHYGKVGLDGNYYQVYADSTGFYIYRYEVTHE